MTLISITDPDDPRVAAFRHVKERDLTGRQGRFIAEGKGVVRILASPDSLCRAEALLLAENRVEAMADAIAGLPAGTPTYVAGQGVLDAIAGFHLHRGVLALGAKPPPEDAAQLLARAPAQAVVVCAVGVGNHDNMGGLFRNAAAFGAHAVLLAGCCDPFYRKAIRVSVGAVLRTPMAEAASADAMLDLLEAAGFETLALTPSAAEPLSAVRGTGRQALLLGAEGPGLPSSVLERCRAVGVPMAGGFDSLNVAATSAVALFQLTRR